MKILLLIISLFCLQPKEYTKRTSTISDGIESYTRTSTGRYALDLSNNTVIVENNTLKVKKVVKTANMALYEIDTRELYEIREYKDSVVMRINKKNLRFKIKYH